MTTKNYNAKAAEMMDWTVCLEIDPDNPEWYVFKAKNGYIIPNFYETDHLYVNEWNPLQDRNQAYQLLKRAEALGILSKVVQHIALDYACEFCAFKATEALLCPTDIIVMACVDVWEAGQEKGTKEDA